MNDGRLTDADFKKYADIVKPTASPWNEIAKAMTDPNSEIPVTVKLGEYTMSRSPKPKSSGGNPVPTAAPSRYDGMPTAAPSSGTPSPAPEGYMDANGVLQIPGMMDRHFRSPINGGPQPVATPAPIRWDLLNMPTIRK
jgi:hypothetical protein